MEAAAAYAESRKLWPDAGHHVIVSLGAEGTDLIVDRLGDLKHLAARLTR